MKRCDGQKYDAAGGLCDVPVRLAEERQGAVITGAEFAALPFNAPPCGCEQGSLVLALGGRAERALGIRATAGDQHVELEAHAFGNLEQFLRNRKRPVLRWASRNLQVADGLKRGGQVFEFLR